MVAPGPVTGRATAAESSGYTWIVVVAGFLAVSFAWGMGANDVPNSFASTVGSNVLTLKQAVVVSSVFELIGVFGMSNKVVDKIKKGVVDFSKVVRNQNERKEDGEALVMWGLTCCLAASSVWVITATLQGWPVSSTQTVIGAMVVLSLVYESGDAVEWKPDLESEIWGVFLSWIVTPPLTAALSGFSFLALKRFILQPEDSQRRALMFLPLAWALTAATILLVILFESNLSSKFKAWPLHIPLTIIMILLTAGIVFGLARWLAVPRARDRLRTYDSRTRRRFEADLLALEQNLAGDGGGGGGGGGGEAHRAGAVVGGGGEARGVVRDARATAAVVGIGEAGGGGVGGGGVGEARRARAVVVGGGAGEARARVEVVGTGEAGGEGGGGGGGGGGWGEARRARVVVVGGGTGEARARVAVVGIGEAGGGGGSGGGEGGGGHLDLIQEFGGHLGPLQEFGGGNCQDIEMDPFSDSYPRYQDAHASPGGSRIAQQRSLGGVWGGIVDLYTRVEMNTFGRELVFDEYTLRLHGEAERYSPLVEELFYPLQILPACAMAFAHGANDVANQVAPFSLIYDYHYGYGVDDDRTHTHYWMMAMAGVAICLGFAMIGWRVTRNLGGALTLMTPSRGFTCQLCAAFTVVMVTVIGVPVSTTQILIGSTVGVGAADNYRTVDWWLFGKFFLSWLATVVASGGLTAVFVAVSIFSPSVTP